MEPLRLVVRERRAGTYAVNVLLGALDAAGAAVPVRFAGPGQLADEIRTALAEADRVLVAWTSYSAEVSAAAAELAHTRAALVASGAGQARDDEPRVVHLLGGVHAIAEPQRSLDLGWDLVCTGEGELAFPALVGAVAAGSDELPPGFAWPGGDSGPAPRAEDLDDFPPWAAAHGRYNPIELTRGCVYGCRFCQTPFLFRARFRHRSVEAVAEHVRHLRREGMRYVRFITPTAMSYGSSGTEPDLAAVEALLAACRDAIGPGGKVYFGSFPSEIRPEHITRDSLALVRRFADNTSIIVGAQSGSEAVLEGSNRGHGTEDVERAVRLAIEAGLRPDVDFLFGLPGEGAAEAAESVALAGRLADLGARIHAHTFMPLPGTPFRNEAPGRLDGAARVEIERLAGRGAVYGQWKAQERRAVELVPLARRQRPKRADRR